MAEGLLRASLQAAGVEAEVRSAGIYPGGSPVTGHALAVLADRGIDLRAHVSRTLAADEVAAADLVIAMERRHVQEAVVLVPGAEAWTFTLRDVAARADAAPARGPDESVRAWAARLAAGRARGEILGEGDDGVADPIGQPRAEYERTAAELDDLLTRLAARLFPECGVMAPDITAGSDRAGR
jgi:protein-tyrosine phosphatase